MIIRPAAASDIDDVLTIETQAFGYPKEAQLVNELLDDPTAKPLLSLLAFINDRPVGHILFTNVRLTNPESSTVTALLAPLAVLPDFQKQGVGGQLIQQGLQSLKSSGTQLVFVLGHPDYYPRFGFEPAGRLGFTAPYPIPEEYAGAWMVQALQPGVIGSISGTVVCADALNQPQHWRE